MALRISVSSSYLATMSRSGILAVGLLLMGAVPAGSGTAPVPRPRNQRYAAKVRKLDQTLRTFFDELKQEKLLDNTIVIITSDHGEAFGEAGFITHMLKDHGDREANYHVPLLIVLPPRLHRKAAVVDRVVSLDMLAPTIYDMEGIDWSASARRYPTYAPSLISFVTERAPRLAAVQLPKPERQDHRHTTDEREKTMRSLGYIH